MDECEYPRPPAINEPGVDRRGQRIHEFNDIEPLHQAKNSDGTGGLAPILFADLHVAKVVDSVDSVTTAGAPGGRGLFMWFSCDASMAGTVSLRAV